MVGIQWHFGMYVRKNTLIFVLSLHFMNFAYMEN
jgi:hypothetical protein